MKIATLLRGPKLYSTRRLVEAAQQRGHEVQIIDVLRCYMNINSVNPEIHYKGEILEGFDAVIPRIGASVTFYGTAALRQFEMMDVFLLTNRWRSAVFGISYAACSCYREEGWGCL